MKLNKMWPALFAGFIAVLMVPISLFAQSADEVQVTIMHTNDIYEILPVSGGTAGGLARVATLKQQLLKENPNTYLTLSGDYHGPSGMGLAEVDGVPLAGEQTVAVLNKVGIDFSTFGDHEFDVYDVEHHLDRLEETTFPILSSNVFSATGESFDGVKINDIITATNAAGQSVRIGLFGITEPIPRVSAPVITYTNAISAAVEQVALLEEQTDVIIALTHQKVGTDQELAQQAPGIDLILGGDEHENMRVENGEGNAIIYKSDSNARNIQIINLYYNTVTGELRIEDELYAITDEITDAPDVKAEADRWTEIAFDAFRADGINPTEVIAIPSVDIDGLATSVRKQPTEFTRILLEGIHAIATEPELSLYVSGLIRLDDVIPAGGEFTRYDIQRAFPLNTQIMTLDITGAGLEEILNLGEASKGSGFYILKTENVTQAADGSWLIDGEALDTARTYRVGGDFAVLGNFESMGVTLVEEHDDFASDALAQQLAVEYPSVPEEDQEVQVTIMHTNDIYEILPVSGGTAGGLARVATLKQQLLKENPNTYLTLSGDYHGPSGMGLAEVDGVPLAGEQTVAVLNKVGIDFSTFGDHEFDVYDVEHHLDRLEETTFPILSSNVFSATGESFDGVKINDIITATNAAGQSVRIGLFGITEPIPRVSAPVITYTNAISAAVEQVALLEEQTDVIIALTHQKVGTDQELAQQAPGIDLILGGDEHENMRVENGEGNAIIYKSDSNARNIQIINLYYNTVTGELRIEDELYAITDEITDAPDVKAEADRWTEIAFDAFRADGINPTEVIAIPSVDIDGLATSVRKQPTEFTRILLEGIHAIATEPELSLYVSGLIRLDDVIPAGGEFTRYDILRAFPLDTQIMTLDITGAGLEEILNLGEASKGSGFYILKTENVTQAADGAVQAANMTWLIDGQPLDTTRTYRVGGDFAVLGNFESMGVTLVEEHDAFASDALAQRLRIRFATPTSLEVQAEPALLMELFLPTFTR